MKYLSSETYIFSAKSHAFVVTNTFRIIIMLSIYLVKVKCIELYLPTQKMFVIKSESLKFKLAATFCINSTA